MTLAGASSCASNAVRCLTPWCTPALSTTDIGGLQQTKGRIKHTIIFFFGLSVVKFTSLFDLACWLHCCFLTCCCLLLIQVFNQYWVMSPIKEAQSDFIRSGLKSQVRSLLSFWVSHVFCCTVSCLFLSLSVCLSQSDQNWVNKFQVGQQLHLSEKGQVRTPWLLHPSRAS